MHRDFATMEPIGQKLYLWGGRGDLDPEGQHTGTERYENMLHIFNVASQSWTDVSTPSAPPARRSHASFVYGDRMYIFGGYNGRDHFNDMWLYDPETACWNEISKSTKFWCEGINQISKILWHWNCCYVLRDSNYKFDNI